MSLFVRTWQDQAEPNMAVTILLTALATTAVIGFLKYTLWPTPAKVIPGPLHSVIPKLNKQELAALEYKTDAFPGARDVETPYGCIRVYEWGPEDGTKVLMVHGISTTCQTMTPLAHALVDRGCRVMLFDLWGRGYSDGVGDVPHDARLYTTQILLSLASSPLPWTGDAAFRLIGYSMGGGIAVHFAGAFPRMVESLVLLAPAGLIRPENFGTVTRYIFTSGIMPMRLLSALTARRLQKPIAADARRKPNARTTNEDRAAAATATTPLLGKTDPVVASLTEAVDADSSAPLVPLEKRVLSYVQWMVKHHAGFIPAFCSSIADAPLMGQHESWAKLAQRAPGTTAVILGDRDEIIDPVDYERDALPLAGGREKLQWSVIPGGAHDFPMTHAKEAMVEISKLWNL